MSDNLIETTKDVDTILIDEKNDDLSSLWSQFKESPNKWVYLGLITLAVSLPLMVPYVFFGSYAILYFVGSTLIALVAMYLGFSCLGVYSKPSKSIQFVFFFLGVLSLCNLYHVLNYDKHVLVDYHERVEGFSYDTITKELSNPLLGGTNSFTILVKSEDLKWKGPDFDSLATKVRSGSKEYHKGSLEGFKPFTISYGKASEGKVGDIKGKRTVYGWFGSTSTEFVIEIEK